MGAAEGCGRSGSVQHGIQLVRQGVEHGADVVQNVLGGGAGGAVDGGGQGQISQKSDRPAGPGQGLCTARLVSASAS